jgi:hypothetical protein
MPAMPAIITETVIAVASPPIRRHPFVGVGALS